MIATNEFQLQVARQTARGAYPAAPTYALRVVSGGLSSKPTVDQKKVGDGSFWTTALKRTGYIETGGEPVLIDFQGMRFGSFFYDLGALLYDPYVSFTESERLALLRDHYERHGAGLDWPEYEERFREASAQRLRQSLGAYGVLGLKRGRRDFLAHVGNGLANLIDASTRAKNLPALRNLARKCREALGREDGRLQMNH